METEKAPRDELSVRIYRHDPSVEAEGRLVEYRLPYKAGMVVLDAVLSIQAEQDPTLAVRWNCKAAHCGSCSAEINGVPRLMCKTKVDDLKGEIEVRPMKAFPLVKDLVIDVAKQWETARKIPPFTPRKGLPTPWLMHEEDVQRSHEFRKCIECFICQDICHVIREHGADYIGPRFVVKAASLDTHPLDALDRSRWLKETGGLGLCNITKCCEELCPQEIHITDNAIIPEKERVVDKYYDPIAWLIIKVRGRERTKV